MNIFRGDAIEKNPQLLFSFIGNIGKSEKKVVKDNWLGNVNVTISDKKLQVDADGDGMVDYYGADVRSVSDMYPGGEIMPSRNFNSNSYRFGMNGQEKVSEIAPDHYAAEFWEYDSRTIHRWNIDPITQSYLSPYSCFDGNPILYSDPLGNVPGDYYSKGGKHLGSDEINDDKVYTTDKVTKNDKGVVTSAKNAIKLNVTHTEFATSANIVKHESSGNKTESLWIAHTANNAKDVKDVFGTHKTIHGQLTAGEYSSVSASDKATQLSTTNNSTSANNARAAVIDVLTGGADPTGGAVLWDGDDFLKKGLTHNKFKEYTKITISADILQKHAMGPNRPGKSIAGTFGSELILNTDYSETGTGKYYSLQSTGSPGTGRSIFWKLGPK